MTPYRRATFGWRPTARPWTTLGTLGTVLVLSLSAVTFAASAATVAAPHASAGSSVAPTTTARSGATAAVLHPSVSPLQNVTFKALRLPNGSKCSVTAGSPPVLQNNTTSGNSGAIVFQEPNGTLNYSIAGPTGWGVAKIEGPTAPSQTSDLINGTTRLTVFFAPIVNLTFNETGLPAGTVWGISIHTALPHGGPAAPANLTTNGTSLTFQVVKGTWKFVVTPVPFSFKAKPAQGAVGTGHVGPKIIKFREILGKVVFRETGLVRGTQWQVNISGPVSGSFNSTGPAIRLLLMEGNYTFTVWNFSSLHPQPETGTFTVTGPGTTVEAITYS